jgi:hypothetical protein
VGQQRSLLLLVRAAHQQQRGFDAPPVLGLFFVALLFAGACLLSGFGNGFGPVGFRS